MRYKENDQLIFKKKHACGGNIWNVIKAGGILKLECNECKRVISLLPIEVDKRIKK